jgi:hypothetical protein
MLDQNDVIEAVCGYLESEGFVIGECGPGQSPNITATRDGRRILVEARGNTSSKPSTSRYGEPFNRGQVSEHVAQNVYRVLKLIGMVGVTDRVALAFASDEAHCEAVEAVQKTLQALSISIYWVDEAGDVVVG